MKISAILFGAMILFWCDNTDAACSLQDATLFAASATSLSCSSSLLNFLSASNISNPILTTVCTDSCLGTIYRWYLQNCQANPEGLLNATRISDACSQNSNGLYCAQAFAGFNSTLLATCTAVVNQTSNCSMNCSAVIKQSLGGLGCCLNSTTGQLTTAPVAGAVQTCALTTMVERCKAPFPASSPSPSPLPNAAVGEATPFALVVHLMLLFVCAAVVRDV